MTAGVVLMSAVLSAAAAAVGGGGGFRRVEARDIEDRFCCIIDSKLLPSLAHSTLWDKNIPRKVNIFAWRMVLDHMPHKLNLSSRGIDIPTISYFSCNGNVESSDIFSLSVILLRIFGRLLVIGVISLFLLLLHMSN
ncbi:RNA-directed DNA polymerase, eukaryota [Tanacetum coccineum]